MTSGIYQIRNKKDGKVYIGSSSNIEKRFRTHILNLRKGIHHSIYLQRAWKKYGKNCFIFEIIKKCKDTKLIETEQKYLDSYNPKYNISLDAIAPMKRRKHSKKTLAKFKKRKVRSGKDNPMFGKKWSKELRKKILRSRKGYKHSKETKLKMSETSKRLNRVKDLEKVRHLSYRKIIDSNGNKFKSMVECAKFWGISPATICDILKGRHSKTRKKISFKYA